MSSISCAVRPWVRLTVAAVFAVLVHPATAKSDRSAEEIATALAQVTRFEVFNAPPLISPDAQWIIYGLQPNDVAKNEREPTYWLKNVRRDAAPIRMPAGIEAIRWTRDSRSLTALLPGESKESARVFSRYDIASHAWSRITLPPEDANNSAPAIGRDYQWSSSGRYLAYTASTSRPAMLDPTKGVSIRQWKPRTENALYVIDFARHTVRRLTTSSLNYRGAFAWSPDERQLAISVERERSTDSTELMIVDRETGQTRSLVRRPGENSSPMWSPDGERIAFVTQNGTPHYVRRWPGIVSVRDGKPIELTGAPTISSLGYRAWSPDGRFYFYGTAEDLLIKRVRLDTATGETRLLNADDPVYEVASSTSADGHWMISTRETALSPPELYLSELNSKGERKGSPRPSTSLNANTPWHELARVERVQWLSPDGRFTIHALLLRPQGIPGPLPTVLQLWGGPSMVRAGFAQDGVRGPALALVERGYAVLIPNTRGRGGYGEAFQNGIADGRSYGKLPFQDAMAGIDKLIADGVADPQRLGVIGHSYGGYLAAYAVTQTQRFKAAVIHEGVEFAKIYGPLVPGSDPDSADDLLLRDLLGTPRPIDETGISRLIHESPALNMHKVKTPSLLQFGARAGAEPFGVPYWNACKRHRIPCAFFIYDSGHTLSRPAAIADDLTRTVEWLDHWVRNIPFPNPARAAEYMAWKESESMH